MKELTDLEICKKIAEIEGLFTTHNIGWLEIANKPYNPLTDDALCMELIKKYHVNIRSHPQAPSFKYFYMFLVKQGYVRECKGFWNDNISDNKAALLAIIEAKK